MTPPPTATSENLSAAPAAVRPGLAAGVVAAYRRMAPVYDWLFGLSLEPGRRSAVRSLAVARRERVLEIGVGTGLALPLWPADAQTVGIDLCPDMLHRAAQRCARRGLSQVALRAMDAQRMDFPDNHFDKIAAMYVVSVVPDPAALLREVVRVGRPGARVAVINHFAHRRPLLRALERGVAGVARLLGFDSALPIDGVLAAPGLRILSVRAANWFGYWTLIEAEVVKPAAVA